MRVITIGSRCGSGEDQIGAMLAERLHIPLYDRALCTEAAERSGIHPGVLAAAEEGGGRLFDHVLDYPWLGAELPLNDRIFFAQAEAIRTLAEREACVIVGRGGNRLLSNRDDVLHVFIHADTEVRARWAAERYGISPQRALGQIRKADKSRVAYLKAYTNQNFEAAGHYHLCVDSGVLGLELAAELICAAYQTR